MKTSRNIFLSLLLSSGLLITGSAFAITPASVDPGRIDRQLAPPIVPRTEPTRISLPVKKAEKIPAASKIKFTLKRVIVKGNTVLSDAELSPLYQDKVGKRISVSDLQDIAHAITVKYRDAGFVLSRAILPPQKIASSGVVTIQVVEGYISATHVKGDVSNVTQVMLEKYAKRIEADKPLTIKTLERYALFANDLPGITVQTVISPSKSTSGAAELTFVAQQQSYDGYFSWDNQGTPALGPHQFSGGAFLNSQLTGGDRTGIQGVITNDGDELRYIAGSHENQIGSDGLAIGTFISYARTQPDFPAFTGFNVLGTVGHSFRVATDVRYPIIRSRKRNLWAYGVFDILNSKSDFTAVDIRQFEDRIRSLRFGFTFDLADKWRGINYVNAQVSQGLDFMGAKSSGSLTNPLSRLNGDESYTKLNAEVSRLQYLFGNVSLLLSAAGQYAFDPLLSAEEFGVGGLIYGRAYDPSEIVGDHGIAAKGEVRLDFYPQRRFLQHTQVFVFYDGGVVWNRDGAASGQPGHQSLTSLGAGVRVDFTPYFFGHVYLAKPLTLVRALKGKRDIRGVFALTLHA